jgi:deoxyribodipyrimidine photo-lyase
VRRVWYEIRKVQGKRAAEGERGWRTGPEDYLRQLGWREFAHHLLYHFPHTAEQPLREQFARFPWRRNKKDLTAWRKGLTGYPLVDAGMRELWATGWMHNRVRMVAGSFLVKDLRLPWLEGAKWFWDTLVDADLANNTLGWQWVAGCGADAAPYFRVFNPVSQSERFDPKGEYVRRWIPEIARLPNRWIHKPWQAPPEALKTAGIVLGKTYPNPVVDHAIARREALAAFQDLKGEGGSNTR